MDRFEAMQRFLLVAQYGSFTRAAEALDLPKSSISSAVQFLERKLGTRLFHRSTRRVTLTNDGEAYLIQSRAILMELDAVESQFQQQGDAISGVIKVDMPSRFASTVVLPHLSDWLDNYPNVQIKISSADDTADLVKEGIDCVVRVGDLNDSVLIARPLAMYQPFNCVSPEYLEKFGEPKTLASLQDHWLIDYSPKMGNSQAMFEYVEKGKTQQLAMPSVLAVNGTDAYLSACLSGLGIAQIPALGIRAHLEAGRLVRILPKYEAAAMPVSLLYLSRRQVPRRLSLFMDWLDALVKRVTSTSG